MWGKLILIISAVTLYSIIVFVFCFKPKELFTFCGGGIIINDTVRLEDTIFWNDARVLHNITE
jgi:hypothetical protein